MISGEGGRGEWGAVDCWLEDAKDGVLEASVLHAAHSWRDLLWRRDDSPSPVSAAGNVSHLQVCVCSE